METEIKETSKLLLEKYLGDRLNQVVRKEGARIILVASPRKGEGKSLFIELIRRYLEKKWPDTYAFITFEQLSSQDPGGYSQHQVIIDGFALNEGEESLNLPQQWQEVIEAAILLVMGRKTTQADIKEAIARLSAMDIRPIGVVFNELQCPSWASTWSRIKFWQKRPTRSELEQEQSPNFDKNDKSMGYLKLEGLIRKEYHQANNEPDDNN